MLYIVYFHMYTWGPDAKSFRKCGGPSVKGLSPVLINLQSVICLSVAESDMKVIRYEAEAVSDRTQG